MDPILIPVGTFISLAFPVLANHLFHDNMTTALTIWGYASWAFFYYSALNSTKPVRSENMGETSQAVSWVIFAAILILPGYKDVVAPEMSQFHWITTLILWGYCACIFGYVSGKHDGRRRPSDPLAF